MSTTEPTGDGYTRDWLAGLSWESIESLNMALCANDHVQHGRSASSGEYEATKRLWNEARDSGPLHFADVVELCEKAHRLAPFLNFNGNTFVAVIRRLSQELPLGPAAIAAVRQSSGHYVAGVLSPEDARFMLDRLRTRNGKRSSR